MTVTSPDNEANMRPTRFILLSLFSSLMLSKGISNLSCEVQDFSEAMFIGDIIVKAKLKKIEQVVIGDDEYTKFKLSVSKIYKNNTSANLPKRLFVESCVKNLEVNKKYIFILRSFSNIVYEVISRPIKPSKKVSRIIRNIICDECGQGPKIKPLPNHLSVKIYR